MNTSDIRHRDGLHCDVSATFFITISVVISALDEVSFAATQENSTYLMATFFFVFTLNAMFNKVGIAD